MNTGERPVSPAIAVESAGAGRHELHWNSELPPLSAFTSTKDIRYHPLFMGGVSRFLWKLMMLTLTRSGRWFLVATLLVSLPASISLEVQPYVLLCYAAGIWVLAFAFHLLYRPQTVISTHHANRVRAGDVMTVDIDVTQKGRFTGSDLTLLPHGLPLEVDAIPDLGVRLPALAAGSKASVRLGLLCKKRGVYQLRGYRVETDFPFGVIRSYQVHWQSESLVAYPAFHPLTLMRLPTGRRHHPGGVALASHLGESFEFLGNREYQEGDNVRDIDWRATARLGRPIIREYREEYFLRVGVVLDTYVPASGGRPRVDDFERAVSIAASVSDYMSRQDYIVDLFAAGPDLYHLTAGRSLAYLDQVLDILACVNPAVREPFEVLEPAILENLSKITSVICIFLDWNPARQAFVERLRQAGAGVKVMIVRDGECTDSPTGASALSAGYVPVIGKTEFDHGVEEL